jgi:phosphoribosylanthranilate isomerase
VSNVQVKICGLTTSDAVKSAVKYGADYLGFVFYRPSPRYVDPKLAHKLTSKLPKNVKKVAVVVDVSPAELASIIKVFRPDYIQLHGKETESDIEHIKKKFGIPVIKAIKVRSSDDVAKGLRFIGIADIILFDAKAPDALLPGGNGLSFDWTLLKARKIDTPWILSGGLNLQNIEDALHITKASMLDVSSSLESAPGIKDPQLIELFLKKVKHT